MSLQLEESLKNDGEVRDTDDSEEDEDPDSESSEESLLIEMKDKLQKTLLVMEQLQVKFEIN